MRVDATVVLSRLHDIAYTFDLNRAADILGGSTRVRPGRVEAQALQIKNPPITASLLSTEINGNRAVFSVRIFDFGVCSLRAEVEAPRDISWEAYTEFAEAVAADPAFTHTFDAQLRRLIEKLAPAAERPSVSKMTENYTVYRVTALRDDTGTHIPPATLNDDLLSPLLLREQRPVSDEACRKLLANRFSYYGDDLAIITWDSALVIDPSLQDRDVEYVLEFANAQLLQLRVYDEMLDEALPAMYDSVAAARNSRGPLVRRRYRPVLTSLQTLVADVTETVEHSDNAFKITDDVYLAEIYEAALRLFRSGPWRSAIERKLTIVRETYAMLDAEAQASRAEVLEIAIVAIILAEFIRSLF